MDSEVITENDRKLANKCLECFICKRARDKQKGLAFLFVKKFEAGICPACKAYEKVYQRKAHEPIPIDNSDDA
ncbi:hypothetical protein ACFLZ8_00955 [Planctomycetota bacterium]